MNNEITATFNFNNAADLRVVSIEGEPWFVAKDAAIALGYADTVNAVKLHCKKAKSLKDIGVVNHHPYTNQQLDLQTKVIPESDVYRLIMRSKLESAEAFQDWLADEVIPAIRKTGKYEAQPEQAKKPEKSSNPVQLSRTSKAMLSMAKAFGLKGNQAILSADRATRMLEGQSPLALLGVELVSESKENLLTATDLGALVGLSPVKTNQRLEAARLQKSYRDSKDRLCWELTDKGQPYAELLDVGKKHSDGTPITQIKWRSGVQDLLLVKEAA